MPANTENRVFYFAYGSNMSSKRLKERGVSFLEKIPARLENHKIVFNIVDDEMREPEIDALKGYANIEHSDGDYVEGFIYSIEYGDLAILDKIEVGYRQKEVVVEAKGKLKEAITFIGVRQATAEGLKPPSWYMKYLIEEACELSGEYVDYLNRISVIQEDERNN